MILVVVVRSAASFLLLKSSRGSVAIKEMWIVVAMATAASPQNYEQTRQQPKIYLSKPGQLVKKWDMQ